MWLEAHVSTWHSIIVFAMRVVADESIPVEEKPEFRFAALRL
jgi:hypothetical protein